MGKRRIHWSKLKKKLGEAFLGVGCKVHEYPDLKAMLLDGWVVD